MSTQAVNPRYEILEATPGPDTPPYEFVKARDREQGRVVALQVVPAAVFGGDAPRRREFQAAVEAAQTLVHPSILQVFDQGVAEETQDLYVVREQLRGITLQERIRRIAPFTLAVSTDIAVAVTEALVAAHQAGVPHGDLRPGHVLLSPEGQIKTADFAYGAVVAAAGEEPRAAYLAPELSARPGAAPTAAGDIYALGAMLYEMLTGVLPLAGGVRVSSPRDVSPSVPNALDGLVQKCLHSDPSSRYRTAGTLLADLQAIHAALRSGKPLDWSPLTDSKSSLKPAMKSSDASQNAGGKRQPRPLPERGAAPGPDDPRPERPEREPTSALAIATRFLFGILVLGVIGLVWYGTRFLEVPNDVVVPNLIGKTFDDAKRIAGQQHFTLVESPDSAYSDSMPENQIYEQNPLAGRTIKADKEVTVFRSLGPRLLTVPPLVGTTQNYAVKALLQASLPSPGTITQQYSESVPTGIILSQSPLGSSKVARNTAVNFVISKGRQPPEIPTDLSGNATGPDHAELSWHSAPRAVSYTVTRSLDGDTSVVAQALPDTHFTDTGLKPNTTYSYTISAVNSAGTSDPSDSVLVTTEASPDTQAVLPSDAVIAPPDGSSSSSTDSGAGTDTSSPDDQTGTPDEPRTARLRQFTIAFTVPRHPRRTRHVQIEVQDTTGTNLVYDENHEPGEEVSEPAQGFGNKITFRIFLDGKLVKQQTL